MRQLYSSPRVENIERLDAALKELGIQTRVTNRKSYLTGTPYFGYSERNTEAKWPAVWIVEADDYPRARQLLRDIGLLEAPGEQSYFRETRMAAVVCELFSPDEPGGAAMLASRGPEVAQALALGIRQGIEQPLDEAGPRMR